MSSPTSIAPPVELGQAVLKAADNRRGTGGMILTIATEASLFVILFVAYFYLAEGGWRWLREEPPKLTLAFVMLGLLLTSSLVLHWGEQQLKSRRFGVARVALAGTVLIGLCFVGVQVLEYRNHLRTLTPRTNVYGSIFYTITSFHAAHVIVGLLMLSYVLILPRLEPVDRPPYRPYHNVALYWHFVDVVWIFVVAFLYVAPNLR